MTKKNEPPPGLFFFPQDYFGDALVRLMPPEKRCVWIEAFFLMSESPRRGVLLKENGQPYSAAELATIMNVPVDLVESAWEHVVKEKIASLDRKTGTLVNRRMVRDEIKRIACEKAGKKGWQIKRAKQANNSQLSLTLQQALSVVPVPDPVPLPKTKEEEIKTPPPVSEDAPAKPVRYSEDFEAFWSAYPRHMAKGDAWKAWKAAPRPPIAEILATLALARQSKEWNKDGGDFIPYPATWVRAHGWNDEYTPAEAAKKSRTSLEELKAMAVRDFGPMRKARGRQ